MKKIIVRALINGKIERLKGYEANKWLHVYKYNNNKWAGVCPACGVHLVINKDTRKEVIPHLKRLPKELRVKIVQHYKCCELL